MQALEWVKFVIFSFFFFFFFMDLGKLNYQPHMAVASVLREVIR